MNRISIAGTTLHTPLVSPTGTVQVEVTAQAGAEPFIIIVRAQDDLARYLATTGILDKPGTHVLVQGVLAEHEPAGFHVAAEHLAVNTFVEWAADNV